MSSNPPKLGRGGVHCVIYVKHSLGRCHVFLSSFQDQKLYLQEHKTMHTDKIILGALCNMMSVYA